MSSEKAPEEKKRRIVSIPFLIVAVIIVLVGYFRGEEIMTYAIYLQERWSHNWKVAEEQRYDKLAGPPKEGEYDWRAPDAPDGNGNESSAVQSPAEDTGSEDEDTGLADSEPPAATDPETQK